MSFILDALRRAETQRGSQPRTVPAEGSLGDVAAKPSSLPSPKWIAVLLVGAMAIAIMAITVFRPSETPATVSTETGYEPAPAQPGSFAIAPDMPLAAVAAPADRVTRPLGKEARSTPAPADPSTRVTPGTVSVSRERLSATNTPARQFTNLPDSQAANEPPLPSYTEVILSGQDGMPEFHLDIHVYAPVPERRFVFVNNRKYREGEQLDEGGTVERITPVGVVLNHRGRRFELVPD